MKKLILLLMLLSVGLFSIAQESQTTHQNSSFTAFIDQTFQYVNPSYATTGFLIDKAFPLTNLNNWAGLTLTDSTNMDMGKFSPLYLMFEAAKVGTQSFPSFDVLSTAPASASSATLALLYCNYNKFRDDALSANLLRIQNNQLYDVTGRTQSPYLEKEVFAATALQYSFNSTALTFTLPTAKVVSNINPNMTTLTVDWGDGLGNRNYTVGSTLTVNYPKIWES